MFYNPILSYVTIVCIYICFNYLIRMKKLTKKIKLIKNLVEISVRYQKQNSACLIPDNVCSGNVYSDSTITSQIYSKLFVCNVTSQQFSLIRLIYVWLTHLSAL